MRMSLCLLNNSLPQTTPQSSSIQRIRAFIPFEQFNRTIRVSYYIMESTTKSLADVAEIYQTGRNDYALHHSSTAESARLPAFGGELQPGLYRPTSHRKLANPAPLGLSAFALTTFVLSIINLNTRGVHSPNILIGSAYAYGGVVQVFAGMWEMAIGNTFGATVLSSFGGFWLSFAITLTPGGFDVIESLGGPGAQFYDSFGFVLMGWFVFITLMTLCTLRSTVAFFLLFLAVDTMVLLLGIGYLNRVDGEPNPNAIKAAAIFGLLTAFLAWYNAFAGIVDSSNSFFTLPVVHFPWSETGRRGRTNSEAGRV